MNIRIHSSIHRALATAALVILSVPFLFGQESFIYEAYTEAWLHPESFDQYVAEHQREFNDNLSTCTAQIRDYFNVLYDRDAQRKALCPEESLWHAGTYIKAFQPRGRNGHYDRRYEPSGFRPGQMGGDGFRKGHALASG
ncbi:MAG: hypothetical protein KDC75_22370 [Phaeodactylibacter sp.]|nr:hypothetical protein [Phaeodactylibacter sp.]